MAYTRKGMILAGGTRTQLFPLNKRRSMRLMPVSEKPVIFCSHSVLILAEIREIVVIIAAHCRAALETLLGGSSDWRISIGQGVIMLSSKDRAGLRLDQLANYA